MQDYFTHKPAKLASGEFVHPIHTKPLWDKMWNEARKQPWWQDGLGYVGNKDGWFYFQKPGETTGFARCQVSNTAEQIADRFAAILREWLTPAEFAEVTRLNATPDYADGSCASQNYCDANMAMDQAWREIVGGGLEDAPGIDADDEAQAALWNAAWEIARKKHIGCAP